MQDSLHESKPCSKAEEAHRSHGKDPRLGARMAVHAGHVAGGKDVLRAALAPQELVHKDEPSCTGLKRAPT